MQVKLQKKKKKLSFLIKIRVFYDHFWQRVDAIFENVSFAKIIV